MKEKFIKSTIILLIGGVITKVLGMFIKVLITRYLGTSGIGIYMLILPTFILFLNLSSFGFDIAIRKLVSEDDRNNKRLVFTAIFFILFINLVLIIILIFSSKFISYKLLHNSSCYYGILCIGLVLPFASISSILRSYYFGRERMIPHITASIIEDIVKIILIVTFLPLFIRKGITVSIAFLVIINVISEVSDIFVLYIFLPKRFVLTRNDIKPSKVYLKDELSISVPTTVNRLIGSICYFLEPIILTTILFRIGYSNSYIVHEYGVISGYVFPIILLPSFFTTAISQALLPSISKEYKRRNINSVKSKISKALLYSLIIGLCFTIFIMLYPKFLLSVIYKTNKGINYIRFLAPICLLQYIQAPLSSCLDAVGMSKKNLVISCVGVIIRLTMLPILSLLKIGLWSLIFSTSLNVIVVTILDIYHIRKKLTVIS